MTSKQFIRWSRLNEKRSGNASRGWLVAVLAGVALGAFVHWRADAAGPLAASRAWLAGALAAFALAFMRVPFHLYWRQDAALLAQLPIGGGALFDAAWLRCLRAAIATVITVAIGALPLVLLDRDAVSYATREFLPTPIAGPSAAGLTPIEFALRHWGLTGVLGISAACLMPAVATWAASLVTRGRDALELVTKLGGAPVRETAAQVVGQEPHSSGSSAILGALPGFAATVVIVMVIIVAPWLYNGEAALPAGVVLIALAGTSVLAIAGVRALAPRVMGTILRDVSALDRQRLATLEIRPPTAIERLVASMLGEAALPYRKDARLMRRRYPMAYALGGLGFLVLVIIGFARPADPTPWLVAVLAGAGMYSVALTGRLFKPPIELPRLAATLPIAPAARTRAKVAWVIAWATVFVVIPLVFAAARLA
ncbi:MAG TPA: hypothetical protein VIV11_25310 [Kofleriaceae bacterium]